MGVLMTNKNYGKIIVLLKWNYSALKKYSDLFDFFLLLPNNLLIVRLVLYCLKYSNYRSRHWELLCKKVLFFASFHSVNIGLPVFNEKVILSGECFSPDQKIRLIFKTIKEERNKFRKGALTRIFNHSTEHLYLPGHCKYVPIIFPGSEQITQRNAPLSQENR